MQTNNTTSIFFFCSIFCASAFCFCQERDEAALRNQQFDQYVRLYEEQKWAEAIKALELVAPSSNRENVNQHVQLRILNGEFDEATRLVDSNEAVDYDPWNLVLLARWHLQRSPQKCRDYLAKSLAIEPSPYATQLALAYARESGDLPFAMESLRKLHRRHPSYTGGYAVDIGFEMTNDDLEFGAEQLAIVCSDRPKLAALIEGSPRVKAWLVQRFSGMFVGKRVTWRGQRSSNAPDVKAYHSPATRDSNAVIWVSADIDGQEQLSALVYELLNAENSDEMGQWWEKVLRREIGKEQWVREVSKLEHRALLKRRSFVVNEYFAGGLPQAISPECWFLHVESEFDSFIQLQPQSHFDYLADAFNSALGTVPYEFPEDGRNQTQAKSSEAKAPLLYQPRSQSAAPPLMEAQLQMETDELLRKTIQLIESKLQK